MRVLRLLISALVLVVATSCEDTFQPIKSYPTLESIADTKWYSYDATTNTYYDIYYEASTGHMDGFDSAERTNKISERTFSYTFTPAAGGLDAIVNLRFEDNAQLYGGILIPKGDIQINNHEVYIIQLYELTANGEEIAKDENGNIKSTLQMWME